MKPIVLIHGYSSEKKDSSAKDIYGSLPADLRQEFGPGQVLDINLSRWISLSDGIALDDISYAMERALTSAKYKHLLGSGFHVVIHSTGALVVRNWIRLFPRNPSPIDNLIYLAGANFGSGLAHVGRGTLIRWGRQIFQGVDAGVRVLNELEFGSGKTLDLHLHFLQPGCSMLDDYQVQEFCTIGSQTPKSLRLVPIRYVKEDGSDCTVRVSACNLNFNYLSVKPIPEAVNISAALTTREIKHRLDGDTPHKDWYDYDLSGLAVKRPEIPIAVLYETAHSGPDIGILTGTDTRKMVMPLLLQALSFDKAGSDRQQVVDQWNRITATTQKRAGRLKAKPLEWNRRKQYEGHSQLVFRIRDQFGDDVGEHDIMFNSRRPGKLNRLEWMIEDKHQNRDHPGTVTFYLRTQEYQKINGERVIVNLMDSVAALDFEITGSEPQSEEIRYLPVHIHLSGKDLGRLVEPHRTTVIDIEMLRLPSGKVFQLF